MSKALSGLSVTKLFTFDLAHALFNHDGPCKNIHGHTYELTITISGPVLHKPGDPKDGMVMDFTELKEIVREHILSKYDHSLVLNRHSEEARTLPTTYAGNLILMDLQPTCENLLLEFVKVLKRVLPPRVILSAVRLRETPTSWAEWGQ